MSRGKKRALIFTFLFLAVAAGAFAAYWFLLRGGPSSNLPPVPVSKVSDILGLSGGLQNRYAGRVEPQDTLNVQLDSSRVLGEAFVAVGDPVTVGQALFSYDTAQQKLDLDQMDLDIARAQSGMTQLQANIADLQKLLKAATTAADKLNYTLQIQSLQIQLKQDDFNLQQKQKDRVKLSDSIDNAVVYSTMAGTVQSITDPASGQTNPDGSQPAYMVIIAAGEFRIMGQINEMNVASLPIGTAVTIRSRVNNDQTWIGKVSTIDTENPVTGNSSSGMIYGGVGSNTMTTSTSYNFYVELDSSEGLLLGQHVYIEPVTDQNSTGIWLMEYYIVGDDGTAYTGSGNAYVWAADSRDHLEKRALTLGAYDGANQRYEILSGLALDDEIAFPDPALTPGRSVTRDSNAANTLPTPAETLPGGGEVLPGGGGVNVGPGYPEGGGTGSDLPAYTSAPQVTSAPVPMPMPPATGSNMR
ncbi:MAG: efflux RND transporter periplasmic adaptor subunit [Firmicutes bacterium]|nr:efflux RND transporter periplasmic adaptor subunit [Bacillota bacterium]